MGAPIVSTTGPQVPNVNSTVAAVPDAHTAAGIAQTHGGETMTGNTTFKSMEDMKKRYPKLYNMMMQSLAMNMCNEMQHQQDRLKKAMREGRKGY